MTWYKISCHFDEVLKIQADASGEADLSLDPHPMQCCVCKKWKSTSSVYLDEDRFDAKGVEVISKSLEEQGDVSHGYCSDCFKNTMKKVKDST